jgi:type IV secretory pathway VirB10-like protein
VENEPHVSDRTAPLREFRKKRPLLIIGAFGGLILLVAILNIANERKAPAKVKKALSSAVQVAKPQPVTVDQVKQAQTEISQLKQEDSGNSGQIGGNGQQSVDPAADVKRRRLLAMSLSPGGWEKGETIGGESGSAPSESDLLRQIMQMSQPSQSSSALPSLPQMPSLAQMPWTPTGGIQASDPKSPAPQPYQFAQADPDTVRMPDGSTGYVLRKGRIIEAALEFTLQGEFSGPVRCHVTNDVYDDSGKHLLIPAGSVLLGEAAQVGSQYQRRLAVLFTDLQVPGYTIDLAKATGLDQDGATALRDKINRHLLSTIASVVAVGVLSGEAEANGGTVLTGNGLQRLEMGVGQEGGMEGSQILSQTMSRPPEITIRAGHLVRVYLNRPLVLPAQPTQ